MAIVGSSNVDLVIRTENMPAPGETVLGTDYAEWPGGKGLNQAIAVARETSSYLVSAIGSDHAGTEILTYARSRDVNVDHITRPLGSTGRALIVTDREGENSIVVAPLANSTLSERDALRALESIAPTIVLCQLEVPIDTVTAVRDWCEINGVRWALNASPAAGASHLLRSADPLIVNESEADILLQEVGEATESDHDPAERLAMHAKSVIVTKGKSGSTWSDGTEAGYVPAMSGVSVADSTGAGDEFAGRVIASLARGEIFSVAASIGASAAARVISTPRAER